MTTTTRTATISFYDSTEKKTLEAEYFQIESAWISFKDVDHKVLAAYPMQTVTGIEFSQRMESPAVNIHGHFPLSTEEVKEAVASRLGFELRK